jgi:hypothetical protein
VGVARPVHRVSDWPMPLRDGTTTAQITGTVDWVPPPEPGGSWAAVLLLATAIGAFGLIGQSPRPRRC